MQTFKTVSFNDRKTRKSKVVSIAFTLKEQPLYNIVERLTSQEIRTLIGIDYYDQLCNEAHEDRRNLSQFIKVLLEKALTNTRNIMPMSDVTFKNSKSIPFQRWYPYIEGYSPDFVKSIISQHLHRSCIIYEPFAGTGTTLFAADSLGYNTYYSEINPLLQFLITTKIQVLKMPITNRLELHDHVQSILPQLFSLDIAEDKGLDCSYKKVFKNSIYFPATNYSKILKTRAFIDTVKDDSIKNLLLVAVLASLIPSSLLKKQGDLRFKTPKEQAKGIPDFTEVLRRNIANICDDLKAPTGEAMRQEHICLIENAKKIKETNGNKIGCVITSPPYLNGTNYIRNTKLELWFLGYLKSDKDLRYFRDEILTSGINDVKSSTMPKFDIKKASALFTTTLDALQANAYDQRIPKMAKCYFSEMYMFFKGLRDKLEDGADIFIDIGDSIFNHVHIKTDIILQEIAAFIGYELVETKKLRERRSRNGQIISQKLIHLRYNYA